MSEANVPEFWSLLDRHMSLEAKGLAAPWAAAVAKIVATDGFDDACWIDRIPDTVISVRLGGAHVLKAMGHGSGATTAGGRNFTLQPKGKPNWYLARGDCAFGHILLADSRLDRASDAVGKAKLSGRLRPDLIFSDHRDLNRHTLSYIERGLNAREPPSCLDVPQVGRRDARKLS